MPEDPENPLSEIYGTVICPRMDRRDVDIIPEALIRVDTQGVISDVTASKEGGSQTPTLENVVWLPGFVDTHIHYPQLRVIGSAAGPLLEWLEHSIFPEEARFASSDYAETVAHEFCRALMEHGTTTAAVYSSSHPEATELLFQSFARCGLRGLIGLTLMDQNAPDELCLDADSAMEAVTTLTERWHGYDGRLAFCITPRFALSCTSELMRRAADFARAHSLPIQTHLSENASELEAVQALFPEAEDYLDVYESMGLLGSRSVFAHCIHLSDEEWKRLRDGRASVSHCPDSNFFLGSGQMPLDKVREFDVSMGLGSDIGAGRSISIRRVMASAYDTALLTGAQTSASELIWYATAGGAGALGLGDRIGYVAPGYEADLIAVDVPPELPRDHRLLDALAFHGDHGSIRAMYIRGKAVFNRE